MERYCGLRLILVWASFFAMGAYAQTLPQNFVIEGRLFDTGTGLPINATADVKLEIMVQGNTSCVFYRDTYTNLNLASTDSNSQGVFSLKLGGSTSYISSSVASFTQIFSATSMKGDADGDGVEDAVCSPVSTSPTTAYRVVHISVRSPSGSGSYVALSPDTLISSIPNALVADTLRGKTPTDFLAVNTLGASLSQTNVENVFSTTNYPKLTALLDGSAGDFIHSTPTSTVNLNGQLLTGIATPASATDATNKSYVDGNVGGKSADVSGVSTTTGNGYTLTWSQSQNKWVAQAASTTDNTKLPLAGGTMTGGIIMGGFDIYNTGHITMASQRLLNLGTFTNAQESALALAAADKGKIFYNTDRAEIRLWNGSSFSGLTAPVTSVNGKTGAVTITTADLGLGTAALQNVGTAANNVVQLDSSGHLPAVDGYALANINGAALTNVNAIRIQGQPISSTTPTDKQVLTYNISTKQWEPTAVPSAPVTSVAGKTGAVVIDAGDITSATGKYLTYQPNGTACATGEILKWGSSRWECAADNNSGGTITQVLAGTGLMGGGTTSTVTLSVNVGTGASQIVQLNPSGDLPLIDGHLLFNLNAERIQGRAISSTLAPTAGQSLKWNGTTNMWDPEDDSLGITALTGDVNGAGSGSITTTISNSAVTTAKLADGSVTTTKIADNAVTSAKINNSGNTQNRLLITDGISGASVTYATCSTNQVLMWTGTGWTCTNSTSLGLGGTITGVTAGNGLTGGGSSGTVALTVDAGTSANQIVQLDSSARIPAVDGGLLANVNATRLGLKAVSTTAPSTNGQVLTWNQTTQQWEPQAVQPSATSYVNGGNSFTANATLGTNDNYSLTLLTNSSSRMTILNSGQVGIGTLSPSRDLTVANASGSAALGVTSVSGGTSSVYFGDSVNDARGTIQYSSTTNTMKFMTASSTRMTIDNAGNVGIGTTPATTLDVNGAINGTQLCISSDCRSSWPTGGGSGTVTSVSSANTDITVASGSSTPTLTLNSGTTGGATDANKIAKLDASGLLAVAMVPNLSASKITSGTLPVANGGTGATTLTGYLVGNGTSAVTASSTIPGSAISGNITGNAANVTGKVAIANGGTNSATALNNNRVMISSGGAIVENAAITASRALASDTNGLPVASSVTSTELGYVSGVTSSIQTQLSGKQASLGYTPVNKAGDSMTGTLNVTGSVSSTTQMYSKTQNPAAETVDFNAGGNIAVISSPGGSTITLNNMVDGGSYVIIVSDTTSRTYTFSGCGTSYFNPANAATTASTQTIYNILRVGTVCYISWAPGYQ